MTAKFATRSKFVPATAPVSYLDGAEEEVDLSFDYAEFGPVLSDVMQAHARVIKTNFRRWGNAMVDIGHELEAAKNDCAGMPKGTYQRWVEQEFGLKLRMAQHMVEVANRAALVMNEHKWHLLTDSSLYALASASTPDAAIEAAFTQAEAAGGLTHAQVKDLIDEHREDRLTVDEIEALLRANVITATEFAPFRDDPDEVRTLFPTDKTATMAAIKTALQNVGEMFAPADAAPGTVTIDGEYEVINEPPEGRELTVEQLRDGIWLAIRSACRSQDLREQASWVESHEPRFFAKYLPADGVMLENRFRMALADVAGALRRIYAEQVQTLSPIDMLAMQVAEMRRMFDTRDGWVMDYVELTGDDQNVRRVAEIFDTMLRNVTPAS